MIAPRGIVISRDRGRPKSRRTAAASQGCSAYRQGEPVLAGAIPEAAFALTKHWSAPRRCLVPRLGGRMKRRAFFPLLGGAAAACAGAPRAQPERTRLIGALMGGAAGDDAEGKARLAALLRGLAQVGWISGGNLR